MVFTEFVNAEGLKRGNERTHRKLKIYDEERPVGIQIYGANNESMLSAAIIAEEQNPELIDINAGCWVRNIVGGGAGAALMKDPQKLQTMVGDIVKAVSLPVTVKTRIGWDDNSVNIIEIAQRLEQAGIAALTIHVRTRSQGHSGEPDWSWIEKVKNKISIPVVLNGGIMTPEDVVRAFDETSADALMIARGAIGSPWIFKQAKELMNTGSFTELTFRERIDICLLHLHRAIQLKGETRAVFQHRKFYTGYMKGFYDVSKIRNILMTIVKYSEIESLLLQYADELEKREQMNHTP
jgi:tRNA-dihydrouridine synthase B